MSPLGVHELAGVGARPRAPRRLARARLLAVRGSRGRAAGARCGARAVRQPARPQVVGVVGEAGVGKSRLCDDVRRALPRRAGIPVYERSGQAHGKEIPFLPVLQMMRSYFGVDRVRLRPAGAREDRRASCCCSIESFAEDLPLLFDFLAVPDPQRPAPRMDPEARQRRLLELVKQLVRAQSARAPGVTLLGGRCTGSTRPARCSWPTTSRRPGLARPDDLNFRPEYQRPVDAQVLLPPDLPGAAGARRRSRRCSGSCSARIPR